MAVTGMKPLNKLIRIISKGCIYSWLLISMFMSLIIYKDYSILGILTSLMIFSVIFIPLYLMLYSYTQNRDIKYRLLLSLLSLIPLVSGFYYLSTKIPDLKFLSITLILFIVFYFLINFSILVRRNSYLTLMIFTIFNFLLIIALATIYGKEFYHDELVFHLGEALILLMSLVSLLGAFTIHIYHLILEGKETYAGNC